MPITVPKIDDRRYQDLLSEALARIPVHTPEWTNFNRSDPGVTLVEVFAFLTESLLYRANQIPDRNRLKFLQLLRIPLQSATAAVGLVSITESPSASAVVLPTGLELRASQVPFQTTRGLDVLPIEGRLYYKQTIQNPTPEVQRYYQQLYLSYRDTEATVVPQLYQATPLPARNGDTVALSDAVDNAFWLAILVRDADRRAGVTVDQVRAAVATQTLSLGIVPSLSTSSATLPSGRAFGSVSNVTLRVESPNVPQSGGLPDDPTLRVAQYRPLAVSATNDVFSEPGVVDVTLPDKSQLTLWNNIEPLEAGVDTLPPALEDPALDARVVTWLRISASSPTTTRFLWMGINTVPVTQLAHVSNELLPNGTGEPDQVVQLASAPVVPGSLTIAVTTLQGDQSSWTQIDDLAAAGPEVPVPDPRLAPGAAQPPIAPSTCFALDAESGQVRFGDGAHGARPPEGATLRATYDFAVGASGNVGAGSIATAPTLPAGFKLANPIPTWGGADAESVADGEKQITRYLQHRDRLVTVSDFEAITLRTPGVDIARVEVLPNYHPDFGGAEVPGVVTLMLVPTYDAEQPDAPLPRSGLLDAVCNYLDPRRLVTTEVFLRGPDYVGIWISIGIKVAAGYNEAEICENVKQTILDFLAPSNGTRQQLPDTAPVTPFASDSEENGWKLGKPVIDLELAAVASRVKGVELVQQQLVLATDDGTLSSTIPMTGLQLPRVLGIRVTNGQAASLSDLRGTTTTGSTLTPTIVQIPVIPEECR